MKSILLYFSALLFSFCCIQSAQAWGPEGHAMVADIARLNLNDEAKAEVDRLLSLNDDGHNMDDVSSWADAIRSANPETAPFHYVDIPLKESTYDETRDCHFDKNNTHVPELTCIVFALETQTNILADKSKKDEDRLAALKWVIHLVGDIHQPLHAEDNNDKGGNNVKLKYQKSGDNLHAVWDGGIIEKHYGWKLGPNFSFDHAAVNAEAKKLNTDITLEQRSSWALHSALQHADIVSWANDSHAIAKTAYADLDKDKKNNWPESYQQEFWPVVSLQLQRAGVRLASVLNASLSGVGSASNSGNTQHNNTRDTHENLNSVLWMQQSAEYKMITKGAYANAYNTVVKSLNDKNWTAAVEQQSSFSNLSPAIIMDLDETVLDNSYGQAKFVAERSAYDFKEWNDWVALKKAGAIPGAVEFIQKVQALRAGVRVIFISNRSQAQKQDTLTNLATLNIKLKDPENDVLLCGDSDKNTACDKSRRRTLVSQQYRVLMLVGDDLGDFISGCATPEDRIKNAQMHENYFGERWVVLPNAIYGSWEKSLSNPDFCKGIASPADDVQLKIKFGLLKTKNGS